MTILILNANGTYIQTLLLDFTTRVPFLFLFLYIGEAPNIERGDGFVADPGGEAKILIGQDACESFQVPGGNLLRVRISCNALGVFTRTWFRDGVMLSTNDAIIFNIGPGTYTCVLTSECGAMDSETTLIYS